MSVVPGRSDVSLEDLYRRYARAVVEHGVGLLPGQDLYIRAMRHARDLALTVGEAAYDLGASQVHYRIIDMDEQAQLVRRASPAAIVDTTQVDIRSWHLEILRSRSPLLTLSEIGASSHYEQLVREHPTNHGIFLRGLGEIGRAFMHQTIELGQSVCAIAAAPSASWAQRIFPRLPREEAEHRLMNLLVSLVEMDPQVRAQKLEYFDQLSERLNALHIREMHVTGGGNDFRIALPETARWIYARMKTNSGQRYFINFPSEEVFTTPDFRHCSGRMVASRPFRLGSGVRVEGAVLEFENGEVVHSSAAVGGEDLQKYLAIDAGARRLGEFALVSRDSPLARVDHFFDHPLLDENAGSHIAIGNGWKIPFGADPTDDEGTLIEIGLNQSAVHTDIVFGSDEVTVTATQTVEGKRTLLGNGVWKV